MSEQTGITLGVLGAALRGLDMEAGTPGAIERSEKDGQRDLIENQRLPKKGLDRPYLESIGFVFKSDHDDLFVNCELPAGWTLKGSTHDMGSCLYDDKGIERAGIFYKAAFYDRRASIWFYTRYTVNSIYGKDDMEGFRRWEVVDRTQPVPLVLTDWIGSEPEGGTEEWRAFYELNEKIGKEQSKWLSEHYPNWEDYKAYWNEGER